MPNATWPATLPDSFEVDSYNEAEADSLIRSQVDAGPAKVRRRFSGNVRPVQGRMTLTSEQLNTLRTFFRTTLAMGALPFDWHEHLPDGVDNGTAATFRFVEKPKYAPKDTGGPYYTVDLSLEILP
jgi:hypothetical protein